MAVRAPARQAVGRRAHRLTTVARLAAEPACCGALRLGWRHADRHRESCRRRVHRSLELLHALIYFAPEADEEYVATGLRKGRMGYFASRSAAMGPVNAGVTTATFYNFNPDLVAHFLPQRLGSSPTPAEILAARCRAVDRALAPPARPGGRRRRGARGCRSSPAPPTQDLPSRGPPALRRARRPDWPDGPHVQLWHAVTLLREFRGDGHVAALARPRPLRHRGR